MAQNKPTESELDILSILWQREMATVREVYEVLNQTKPTGYTTVLKIMQIMDEKGLVIRDTQTKAHYYRAKLEQKEAQQNYVRNLLDKVFGGSAKQLVLQALESNSASAEDMKEIRKILKQAENDIKKDGEPKKKEKRK